MSLHHLSPCRIADSGLTLETGLPWKLGSVDVKRDTFGGVFLRDDLLVPCDGSLGPQTVKVRLCATHPQAKIQG